MSGKRPRRAAYALPTLFTSANIFLGFLAILQAFEGALKVAGGDLGPNHEFGTAAKAIGFAVFFDGLDGRIARMTNTTSDFGRELDSIADVITFGIAPAVLAFVWGVLFVISPDVASVATELTSRSQLTRAGYCIAFFYLLCGAVRLARFNVQTNPATPSRPDLKYFVGMPIPAAAAFVAAVVYMDTAPLQVLALSVCWLIILAMVAVLMVSTWRYPSFKQLNVSKPRTPLIVLFMGGAAFVVSQWSRPVLLAMATAYVLSGLMIRVAGILRKRNRNRPPTSIPEHQIG